MKNIKTYTRKIRKLLGPLRKVSLAPMPPGPERVLAMLRGILQADATRKQAQHVLEAFLEEYVDLNELRVSPSKDTVDCIGRDFPNVRQKIDAISTVLNNIFLRVNNISLDYLDELPKRELRRHLAELGLEPYAAAYTVLTVCGHPAIPVDWTLAGCLEIDGCVKPNSDVGGVQALLERIIAPKEVPAACEALKAYAEKQGKAYAKKLRPAPPPPLSAKPEPFVPPAPSMPAAVTPPGKAPPPTDKKPQKPWAKGLKAAKASGKARPSAPVVPLAKPKAKVSRGKAPLRKKT